MLRVLLLSYKCTPLINIIACRNTEWDNRSHDQFWICKTLVSSKHAVDMSFCWEETSNLMFMVTDWPGSDGSWLKGGLWSADVVMLHHSWGIIYRLSFASLVRSHLVPLKCWWTVSSDVVRAFERLGIYPGFSIKQEVVAFWGLVPVPIGTIFGHGPFGKLQERYYWKPIDMRRP